MDKRDKCDRGRCTSPQADATGKALHLCGVLPQTQNPSLTRRKIPANPPEGQFTLHLTCSPRTVKVTPNKGGLRSCPSPEEPRGNGEET